MSSINLTRTEAEERSRLISNIHYDVRLDLSSVLHEDQREFPSTTRVHFQAHDSGETFIDLRAARVEEVLLDGEDITTSAISFKGNDYDSAQGIRFKVTPGEHDLAITAVALYSRTGQGLHRYVDPKDNEVYLYTQFETADAKRVFACFDQPDMKATYDFHILAPAQWKVITNAPGESSPLPSHNALASDVRSQQDAGLTGHSVSPEHPEVWIHESHITYPLSPYLVAVCAGNYHEVRDTWEGKLTHHPETPDDQPEELSIPLAIYCRKSLADHLDADTLFEQTKQGFDFYHANFGIAYPFGKYDQLFVPEFNMGAMENPGAVTFRDEYVFSSKVTRYFYERRCDTILHEMAHMWFGDLVTMRWWDDLWLNESFATWASALSQAEATEFDTAWVTFANVEKSWAYRQDQLPSTHPISTDASDIETVEQNFDGITYAKGASVLKQLQAYVGRDAFLQGVRQYFADFRFRNASFSDLLAALAQASGRDLSHWADQWLKSTGVNTLAADFQVVDNKYTDFALTQSGAQPGAGELRTHRVQVGLYSLIDDRVVRVASERLDIDSERTPVPAFVGQEAADLVLVNDEDLTYALIDLDEASLQFLVEHLAQIEDPMARSLCWSAAWQMTRDGRMRARDFVSLATGALATESEIAVVQLVLRQVATALHDYADPQWAQREGVAALAAALLTATEQAEPGSDHQLAFFQALCAAQLTAAELDVLEGLHQGAEVFPGLSVDTDAKWRVLTALISHGRIADAPAAIDALLAEDHSSAAENHSWEAYAAQNSSAVKQEVYQQLVSTEKQLSNLEIRHKLLGWHVAGSSELLQEFNESIYKQAIELWDALEPEMALVVIEGLIPRWDISSTGVERLRSFLADNELSGGLERKFSEALADVERSLRNREFDAS